MFDSLLAALQDNFDSIMLLTIVFVLLNGFRKLDDRLRTIEDNLFQIQRDAKSIERDVESIRAYLTLWHTK